MDEWKMIEKLDIYAKGAQALVDLGVKEIPQTFIQPQSLRPTSLTSQLQGDDPHKDGVSSADLIKNSHSQLPIIDLSVLLQHEQLDQGDGDADYARSKTLQELRSACQTWGFFHLINLGFPEGLMREMMEVGREFFELPVSEKLRFFEPKPSMKAHYGGSFFPEEDRAQNWRDLLAHPCHPLSDELLATWPDVPARYRKTAKEYCQNTRALALKVQALLSESLGLRESFLDEAFKDHSQLMIINHFPPCPQPHLALGLTGHTDPDGITFVQHDDVPGLEVLKDGSWYPVNPIPNAFVVNIGDQLQILSNGKYRSIEHRTLVNAEKTRISIATFFEPSHDALIAPAAELVEKDGAAEYREVVYGQYLKQVYSGGLKGKHYIHSLKIPTSNSSS